MHVTDHVERTIVVYTKLKESLAVAAEKHDLEFGISSVGSGTNASAFASNLSCRQEGWQICIRYTIPKDDPARITVSIWYNDSHADWSEKSNDYGTLEEAVQAFTALMRFFL